MIIAQWFFKKVHQKLGYQWGFFFPSYLFFLPLDWVEFPFALAFSILVRPWFARVTFPQASLWIALPDLSLDLSLAQVPLSYEALFLTPFLFPLAGFTCINSSSLYQHRSLLDFNLTKFNWISDLVWYPLSFVVNYFMSYLHFRSSHYSVYKLCWQVRCKFI